VAVDLPAGVVASRELALKPNAPPSETSRVERDGPRPLWTLWLLAGAMAGVASALYAVGVDGAERVADAPVHLRWYVLAALFAIVERYSLHVQFRGQSHAFSLNEIVVVAGLFLVSPSGLVAADLVGSGIVLLLGRGRTALKLAFNLSQFALGSTVAVVIFRAVASTPDPHSARTWAAALAATAMASVIASVAITIAISVSEGRLSRARALRTSVFGLVSSAANTMLGLVAIIVAWQRPLAAALLIGPTVVVFVAYQAYLSEHAKREGLQFLYDASQFTNNAHDFEDGLVALLDFARDTLHAELAEIVVAGEGGSGFRTAAGPGESTARMMAAPAELVEPLLGATAASTAALLVDGRGALGLARRGEFAIGSAMIAPLAGASGLRGAVLVAKPADAAAPFDRDSLTLFETFANHLAITLDKHQLTSSLAQLQVDKQELHHQALHDPLTGLANRVLFRERVVEAVARAGRDARCTAVMYIDLDDFKTVNDTMGHAAGDTLLRIVGERISSCIRSDDTAARLGGDEFAVLLSSVAHEADVRMVADRILVALGDPIEIEGNAIVTHASIGIATHAQAMDANELMRNADVAMYTAKRNGKGRFDVFEKTMSLSATRRQQVRVGLERALATGDELVVHYQPVVETGSGKITGAEALVRWQDPSRGLLPPSEFLEIAEESGLILPIGKFVLQEACRQAAQWACIAPGLKMFVNLSPREFTHDEVFANVAGALRDSGLAPSQLVLEVTESTMMQDVDRAREALLTFKDLGVGIAIDDFGTGYTSLGHLRRLPIDVLKIAKPFIDAIDDSPEDTAFVGGIVQLGHMIGVRIVAEGVERVEQALHLVDLGCDMAQGYYYSRSSGPGGLDRLIATGSGRLHASAITPAKS